VQSDPNSDETLELQSEIEVLSKEINELRANEQQILNEADNIAFQFKERLI